MLHMQRVTKRYHDRTILDAVDLTINRGEVIALIGENGAGKTTLLHVLLGCVQPDEGVVLRENETIGFVPQEPLHQDKTIAQSFGSLESWRITYALSLVALDDMESQLVRRLSGGQKTRLAFAQVLAQDPEPTILLLDEPTNNLDSEGLAWLKRFIKGFPGAVLLVSHDRQLINAVATSVVELKDSTLKHYGGNYDFYLEQRAQEQAAQQKQYEAHVEEKKRLEKALRRHREAGKHTHEHIRRSDNDKYQRDFFRNRVTVKTGQQAKNLETRLSKLETIEKPESLKRYSVSLSSSTTHGKRLVVMTNVSKRMGGKETISHMSWELRGGERVRIAGVNGSGKSTLLKLVAGRLEADSGDITYAEGVNIGYFSQEVDGLDGAVSALDNIATGTKALTASYREAMSMGLGEAELRKKPHELSRGQQAKLAFTKLLLGQHDLLILDEPTNHLDIPTKEKLEAALRRYQGALLIASHDSYFVDSIGVTRTIQLEKPRNC